MKLLFVVLYGLATAGNLTVINSGFEERDARTGRPSGWSFTSLPNAPDLVRYGSRAIMTGDEETSALTISVAADHPSKNVAYNAHQDLKGIVPGKKYRVSAKVQTQGLSTLPMIVTQCVDSSGTRFLAFSRSRDSKLAGDLKNWETIETEINIPGGTATLRVRIGIPAAGNAGGTALIDDVSVTEIH